MRFKSPITISLLLLLLSFPDNSYAVKKLGQTGFKWLSIPIGARAVGMGNAFTGIDEELTSVFWNPAGLSAVEKYSITFSNVKWIADINHTVFASAINFGKYGVLGINFVSVDYGILHATIRSNNDKGFIEMGTFSPRGTVVGVAYSRRISTKFSFGAALKYCHEDLGSAYVSSSESENGYKKVSAVLNIPAFDFGTLFYPGYKDLRIGMSLQNFSQERKYVDESFPLPLTFKLGVAMDLIKIFHENSKHTVTFAVDAVHPREYPERLHLGTEYWYAGLVALRAGYKINYDEEDFSAGIGLKYKLAGIGFKFDYAFNNFKSFDAVHIFTIGIGL